MSEDRGACGAVLIGADRGGPWPPLWQVFGPQQGRVSRKTPEGRVGVNRGALLTWPDRVRVSCKTLEAPVSDRCRLVLAGADRVRVSRKTPEGRVGENRGALLTWPDRVRVSRKTLEVT